MYNFADLYMKKKAHILLFFLSALPILLQAQNMNQTISDPVRNRPILIDEVDRAALLTGEIGEFFQADYDAYQPDSMSVAALKDHLDGLSIQVVFGSWCGDSKEQLPRFLKVLDLAGFSAEAVRFIGVDSHKKGRQTDVSSFGIEKVPTFIFFRDQQEIGRIIEIPEESLERDFLRMVSNN